MEDLISEVYVRIRSIFWDWVGYITNGAVCVRLCVYDIHILCYFTPLMMSFGEYSFNFNTVQVIDLFF